MERIDPKTVGAVIYAEHVHRYRWAAALCRGSVLDAACGVGYGSRAVLGSGGVTRYTGVDVSEEAIEIARREFADERAEFVAADLRRLPFADGSFDAVITLETLEHLENPAEAVAEFRRVLRPGGRLMGSVPDPEFERACIDLYGPNKYHKACISRERLAELLAEFRHTRYWRSGLEVVSVVRGEEGRAETGTFEGEPPRAFGSILFLASDEKPSGARAATRVLAAAPLVEHEARVLAPYVKGNAGVAAQLEQRGARIVELRELVANLEKRLEQRRESMARQAAMIEERTALIRKQDELIAARTAAMHKAQEMVRARDEAMRAQARGIEERAAIIGRQEEIIADRNRTIQAQARAVEERGALIRRQDEMIGEIRRALRAAEAMAAERGEAMKNQARMIDERTAYIRKLEQMVNERAEAMKNQARMIDERTAYIRRLEQMVNERAEALRTREELLEASRAESGRLANELDRARDELAAARASLGERAAEAAALRARGEELGETLARTRAELDYLLSQLRRPVFCVRKTVRAIIGPPRGQNGRERVAT